MADIPLPEWLTDPAERTVAEACTAKHTKYQPTEKEFCCPKCEAKAGDFCVDDGPNLGCPLLHEEDSLVCYGPDGKGCSAEYGTMAKTFVRNLLKKSSLVKCPHCNGRAYVKGE